jgi:hypothetical protein
MTPQFTTEAFAALGGPNLVYVRAIRAKDILGQTQVQLGDAFNLNPDQILYAVHRADGERLAVLTDRDSAISAALAHDLAPVSVH